MATIVITSRNVDVKGKVKIKVEDTYNFRVIPEKGSIEKDYNLPCQTNVYKINKRTTTKLTVLRLQHKKSFDSIVVSNTISKITSDYNNKYRIVGFPDDYYILIGKLLFFLTFQKYMKLPIPKYIKVVVSFQEACRIVDGNKQFNKGLGAPLFHIYENVVRKNDSTGIDKLLHFLYSAKHAYTEGGKVSKSLGILKEFFNDEVYSWFAEDNGWDNLDMKANDEGIKFGRSLPRK